MKAYRPKVMIFGEYSGRMRDAFIANGCDAVSFDFFETERPGPHVVGDAVPHLANYWDAVIAHPDCTYLTNAGVRWLYEGGRRYNDDGTENPIEKARWAEMVEAARFFRMLLNQKHIPMIAVENPIMHGHGVGRIGRNFDFSLQPWHHGEKKFKETCFWTKGFTPIRPTNMLVPPKPGTEEHKEWSAVHRAPPGPDRWKERSRTYQGVADAAGAQWAAEIIAACKARKKVA